MTLGVIIQPGQLGCSAEVERILRALPEWFGIEAATQGYIDSAQTKETLLATVDGTAVGFLMIERHFPESAEIYCIAVLPDYHAKGVGKLMLEDAEAHLKADGVRFLQVKTVGPERECPQYAKTRAFYQAVGFEPLEIFPTLWDPDTPCLLLLKTLEA